MKSNGFTLVELMVSMGILLILLALTTINITRLPGTTSQSTSFEQLVTDLRSQQTKAMTGYNAGSYGIHFETTSYTLFTGTYGTENFVVNLDPGITITNNFPNSRVLFTTGSGDVSGYVSGNDTITITNNTTQDIKTIKINKYGATY